MKLIKSHLADDVTVTVSKASTSSEWLSFSGTVLFHAIHGFRQRLYREGSPVRFCLSTPCLFYLLPCIASKPSADIVQLKSRQNDLIWHVDICAFGEKCKLLCKDVVGSYLSEKSGRLLLLRTVSEIVSCSVADAKSQDAACIRD